METLLKKMLVNNGPEEHEYKLLDGLINEVENEGKGESFIELIRPILNEDTLFGHTYLKPFGYAGDFYLIEKIYQKFVSPNPLYSKWDKFYHSHEACDAVRNRKKFFIKTLHELEKKPDAKVLIIGSGPATDVYEYLCNNPAQHLKFHLLDIDQKAIDFAKEKNIDFLDKLLFIKKNVIRFNTEEKFDLIWSAGLFDYLKDKVFSCLIKRFMNNLADNGEMIIGNFSTENPTKNIMEVMGEWHLNHRSEECLIRLAINAGIKKNFVGLIKSHWE